LSATATALDTAISTAIDTVCYDLLKTWTKSNRLYLTNPCLNTAILIFFWVYVSVSIAVDIAVSRAVAVADNCVEAV